MVEKDLIESLKYITYTVKEALDKKAYNAAFICSLTIPDICSKIENVKGKNIGEKYANWYNENVHYSENPPSGTPFNQLDGEVLYLIRCSIFHDGILHGERAHNLLEKKYKNLMNDNEAYRGKKIDLRWSLKAKHSVHGITYKLGSGLLPEDEIIVTANAEVNHIASILMWHGESVIEKHSKLIEDK